MKTHRDNPVRYIFVLVFLIIPAIISGIKGRFDLTAVFLIATLIIAILEKRRDLVDKYF